MTREKQLRLIRKCLKDLGVKGIRMIDCSILTDINENYRNNFLGINIDTFFLCEERKLETDGDDKKVFKIDMDYYRIEYEDYYVYFNASPYMQYVIDNEFQAKPQSKIRNIVMNG